MICDGLRDFSDSLRSRMSSTSLRRALSGWARIPAGQVANLASERLVGGVVGTKLVAMAQQQFLAANTEQVRIVGRSIPARSAYEAPSRKSRFPAMNGTLAPDRARALSDSAISSVNGFSSSSPAQYSNRSPRM